MVVLNQDQYIYPSIGTRRFIEKISKRRDLTIISGSIVPPLRSYPETAEDYIDRVATEAFGCEWRSLIMPCRADRPEYYKFTDKGFIVSTHIMNGYVYDWKKGLRDIGETERYLVESFETSQIVSDGIFKIIENLPIKFFEDVHCAALSFRMSAEMNNRGSWQRMPQD